MNWYEIFYLVTIADNIKSFFDATSNIFSWFAVIGFIAYLISTICHASAVSENSESKDTKSLKIVQRSLSIFFYTSLAISLICWFGYIISPSKKDALIIIAGGAVGNFITSDSSSKHIPAEAMILLRDKIKSEINDLHLKDGLAVQVDTLQNKSKEELIKLIKDKK